MTLPGDSDSDTARGLPPPSSGTPGYPGWAPGAPGLNPEEAQTLHKHLKKRWGARLGGDIGVPSALNVPTRSLPGDSSAGRDPQGGGTHPQVPTVGQTPHLGDKNQGK